MRLRAAGADMVGVLVAGTVGVLAALTSAAVSAALTWVGSVVALANYAAPTKTVKRGEGAPGND